MDMASPRAQTIRETPTAEELVRRIQHLISPNYMGEYTEIDNQPGQIPEDGNCALWITGLPKDITYRELLNNITNVDRVWQTVINPPHPDYRTVAATLAFCSPEGARDFLNRCTQKNGGFAVRNYRATVRYNNRRQETRPDIPPDHTRVIVIEGPRKMVNTEFLWAYFSSHFVFETDEVITWVAGEYVNVLEWRFASYRLQAQVA